MPLEKLTFGLLASGFLLTATALAQTATITLGSTVAEATSVYGQPLQEFGTVMKFQSCLGSESEAKWVFVFVQPLPDASAAEQAAGAKLTGVQRYACDAEKLGEANVKDETAQMLPADARAIGEFETDDGRKAWEFQSQLLAAKFSKGDFVGCDAEGRVSPVEPGTFSYTLSNDGSSWFMGLGTCL